MTIPTARPFLVILLVMVSLAVTSCRSSRPLDAVCDRDPTPWIRLPDLDVQPVGLVRGHVLDVDSQPIVGALLGVDILAGADEGIATGGIGTSKEGTYQLHLPPGKYIVKVYAQGFHPGVHHIEMVRGQTVVVDFTLHRK